MASFIINADDFGLSPGVNRGILKAFRDGVLTSTTMLANLRHFEDAVAIARENPDLPVGIHLSLLWGPPVADRASVPSLLERDGCFPNSLGVLARRYFLGRLRPSQVRLELGAQIRKFLDTGLVPTHLDTHKHVHCLPGIMEALIEVAREFGIDKVRLPREPRRGLGPWRTEVKRALIRWLSRGGRRRLTRAGIRTTDHFAGIRDMNRLDTAAIAGILVRAPNGVTELMCHPGYMDEAARKYSRIPPHREAELEALCDPALCEQVAAQRIRLMSYREL